MDASLHKLEEIQTTLQPIREQVEVIRRSL